MIFSRLKEKISAFLLTTLLKNVGFFYECKHLHVKEIKNSQSGKVRYLCGGYVFNSFNRPRKYAGNKKFAYSVLAREDQEVVLIHYGHKNHHSITPLQLRHKRTFFRKLLKYIPHLPLKKTSPVYWASEYLW